MIFTVETVKAIFTYATAAIVGLGGLLAIVTQPLEPDTKTIVGALIGSSLTFLFGQEVQTRTAHQTAAATAAGVTSANGHT